MQRIILASKACLLHECPLLASEELFLHNLDIIKRTCQTLYGSFCGFCSLGLLPSWLRRLIYRRLIHRCLIHSWAVEHAPMLPPVVARGQQSPKHHIACMDLERKQRIVDGFVEAKPSDNSSQISASPNQCRHHGQLLLVHERHNPVACTFCHLDKEGETNQHGQGNIPWLRAVHHTKAEEEDRFKEKGQELRPNATSETNVLEEDVTGDASQGPSKEVHEAKSSCQGWCICRIHLEIGPEMGGQLVVHGEFRAETCTVLKNHHNDTDVFQHHDIVPQRWFLGLTRHRHIEALGRGCVPTQEFHGGCANQEKDSRNDHGNPPGSVCWHARTHHRIEQHRDHKNLCNTATQVPPASCCGIGRANHVWGKHQRAPKLVGDKGSSCRVCPSKNPFKSNFWQWPMGAGKIVVW